MIAGEFDLSVGATYLLTSYLMALAYSQAWPLGLAVALAIVTGLVIGLVNGIITTQLALEPRSAPISSCAASCCSQSSSRFIISSPARSSWICSRQVHGVAPRPNSSSNLRHKRTFLAAGMAADRYQRRPRQRSRACSLVDHGGGAPRSQRGSPPCGPASSFKRSPSSVVSLWPAADRCGIVLGSTRPAIRKFFGMMSSPDRGDLERREA